MSKLKIAFCIPTYKHPDMIVDFLEQYASRYAARGIDIYIYDSSPDNETKEAVSSYQKKINALYYVRISEEINVYKKIYMIFQQYGMNNKYDFIWPCGDGLLYPVETIDTILSQISLHYDIFHINPTDRENLGTRIYKNINEYFVDCAWHTTLLGSVILNVETMLNKVCWKAYEDRFLKEGYLEFSQVSFYFNRLLELPHFCAIHISGASLAYNSSKKKRGGAWYERFFKVMCVDWVNTIEALPDCYTNKDAVLLKMGKYALLSTEESLLQKRIDGVYDAQVFKQYKNIFPRICDIPMVVLKKTALMTSNQALAERKKRIQNWQTILNSLEKQYHGILIYGAGRIATRYAKFFESENIPFSGFVVSVRGTDTDLLMGYPVHSIEELTSEQKNYGICLGLSVEYHEQVQRTLAEKGMSKQMFFDKELNEYIISNFTP